MPREKSLILAALLAAALATPSPAAEDSIEDLKLSFWDRTINLRGAIGYKDNVLLSNSSRQGSSFWMSGLDFSLLRAGLDGGPSVSLFASGEDRRYFSSSEVDHEQLLLTQAKISQDLSPEWKLGGIAQYLYADEVFDSSTTEQLVETLPVKSHNLELSPMLTRTLPWNCELELKFIGQRQFFNQPLDSYWQYGPELTVTRKYGNRSTVSFSYRYAERLYDTRNPLDLTRQPLGDIPLHFDQHEFELAWNHAWDAGRHWRTRSRALFEINEDNGVGFYDFHRYRLMQKFGYYGLSWQATLEGKILYYDYLLQPVPDGTDIRQLWEYALSAHIEKTVWKKLKLFADEEFETVRSNYRLEEYRVNTIMAGVDWEF